MLQKVSGTAGSYNTSNYDTNSTSSTYIALSGKTLTSSSLYTKPTGSTYKGYSIGAPSTSNASVNSSGSASLTSNITVAYWFNRNSYTLTYNNQSGSGCSSVSKLYGDTWGDLCTPTRTGYTFNGWYTSTGGSGTHVTSSTTVSGNLTVYAYWTAKTYTVTFNANGGSVSTSSKTVTYGSTYGTLPTPTYSGYNFVGWHTSKSGGTKITSSSTVSITSATTLYAHWIKVTCTKSLTWSNSSGSFTATGSSVGSSISKLYYKKLNASNYSNVSSSSKEISGSYYSWYVYAEDSDGNTSSAKKCYASYDNLKPYTPYVSSATATTSNTTVSLPDNCSVATSTSDINCTITVSYTGDSASIKWIIQYLDQSSTEESGCSGIDYYTEKYTYSDGTTCTKTSTEDTCSTGKTITKREYYVYDNIGNQSSKLTIYIEFNKS